MVVALLGGAVWRQANGRMRAPRARQQRARQQEAAKVTSTSALAIQEGSGAARLPVATSTAALVRSAEPADQQLRLTGEQIGGALGERATLVQFSSAFCAPCRATRRILADVAGMTGGVAYVEIDAESRLDLVRRHPARAPWGSWSAG
jgi:thiol-disulfide isomerase/thioredoxin